MCVPTQFSASRLEATQPCLCVAALYIAERNAREEVEKRAHIQKKLAAKDKERKEDELRELAQRAREERAMAPPPQQLEELEREEVREWSFFESGLRG
jgi:hypothetical protein